MNKKISAQLISATEIVGRFSVTYQTVNHYTNLGLLDVVTKNGNTRMYDRGEVRKRLVQIARLAGEGYSLRLIRRKLTGV